MGTIILVSVLVMAYLFLYLINMLYGWELVFLAVFALPVWMYACKDQKRWNFLLGTQLASMVARFVVCTVIGKTVPGIALPLTIDNKVIRQFCGITNLALWEVWLVILCITMIATVRIECGKVVKLKQFECNHVIIRATNIVSTSTVLFVFAQVVMLIGYSMQDLWLNVLFNIGLTVVISLGTYIYCINTMRQKKEAIVEEEKDKELDVIELDPKEAEVIDMKK